MLGLVQDGCVVPVGVMVFIPGRFCYGRLLNFPLFCCCLVFFKAGLQASLCLSNVYVRSQSLQGILYTTPDFLMAGLLSLIHLGELLVESVDVHMLCFHRTESVIYVSLPDSQYMWCRPECKLLKHLHSKCAVKMYV